MFTTVPMKKVQILVLKADVAPVTKALGELGVIHLTSEAGEVGQMLEPELIAGNAERCRQLMSRLEILMEALDVPVPAEAHGPGAIRTSLAEVERAISRAEEATSSTVKRVQALEAALSGLQSTMEALSPYRTLRVPLARLKEVSLLHVAVVSTELSHIESLRADLPQGTILVPLGPYADADGAVGWKVLIVTSRKGRFGVQTVLEKYGLAEEEIPGGFEGLAADIYEEAERKCKELNEELNALKRELAEAASRLGPLLRQAYESLTVEMGICEAERNFTTTWATASIGGWAPADEVDNIRRAVMEVTNGRAVIEVREARREEIEQGKVPTQSVHSRLMRPFERLVSGYGSPSYGEIEPTLLFAFSFLLMFGIVFGDLGHGLCLLVGGLAVYRWGRDHATKDVGYIITAAGLASALFGTFFQGSFFGRSLKDMGFGWTLGFEPLRLSGGGADAAGHVIRYLELSLILGVTLISLGMVLNVVNRLRSGDVLTGILDPFGMAGIAFYWGALALVVKLFVAGAQKGDLGLAMLVLMVPALLMVFREPIRNLVHGRAKLWDGNPIFGLFREVVEVGEKVLTYLANTLSFLRVAAFALSHAGLCFTIFVLMKIVYPLSGGFLWAGMVFVVGTALIIALEGLIVTIQIMRLEYYEFFSKFFRGGGVRYEPFRLGQQRC